MITYLTNTNYKNTVIYSKGICKWSLQVHVLPGEKFECHDPDSTTDRLLNAYVLHCDVIGFKGQPLSRPVMAKTQRTVSGTLCGCNIYTSNIFYDNCTALYTALWLATTKSLYTDKSDIATVEATYSRSTSSDFHCSVLGGAIWIPRHTVVQLDPSP